MRINLTGGPGDFERINFCMRSEANFKCETIGRAKSTSTADLSVNYVITHA